ncbi:MAG: NAD-dependent epimerase/dehydratase family protein [Mycoplasma sp.]
MKNNILIIGGSGFIGSNIITKLLTENFHVFCVDIKKSDDDKISKNPNYKFIDILNSYDKNKAIRKELTDSEVSIVINLSWKSTSGNERSNWDTQYSNVLNNIELMNLLQEMKISKYINFGSIMETEICNDLFNETINKNKLYGLAKLTDHFIIKSICDENRIDFISLLITNTFGVGEKSDRLVNQIIRKYIDDESLSLSMCNQLYNFIYIDDLVEIVFLLIKNGRPNIRYVVGSEKPETLRIYIEKIYNVLNEKTNKKLTPKFDHNKQFSLTNKELSTYNTFRDSNYKCKISFEEGVLKTYEWIKKQEFKF